MTFFAATSQRGLRERLAVRNDKYLKSVFSFAARNTCVILRRHVFVTSYVVATKIFRILFQFQGTHEINKLAPVVERLDSAIYRINRYPVDSVVCFVNTYPLDSDLSGG